jgi:glycosyltransferase involved in cell wall biosynthesis
MRIAIFSDTFLPQLNGVVTTVYQSAKSLIDLGHEVVIFTVAKDPHKYIDPQYGHIKIITLPSIPAFIYPTLRFTFPFGFAYSQLKKFNPDVIHTHTPFAVGWEAVIGSKILNVPLVGTHHTFYDDYLKHVKIDYSWGKKLSWKYTAVFYNCCDLILSPTQSLADALETQKLKKSVNILRNSLDTDFFKPVKSAVAKNNLKEKFGIKGQALIFQGRLSYEKSHDIVLRAFALMIKKMPDLKLMMAGDGPEREKLEKLAQDLKIRDNVIFTGFIPYGERLVDNYQSSDVYITASKSENMPIAILEAMACGLPIIAVKERGLGEIINDGVNGFFAKTDDPTDMAKKTLELLSDATLLKKFSKASRKLALQYSHKQITSDLEQKYRDLI